MEDELLLFAPCRERDPDGSKLRRALHAWLQGPARRDFATVLFEEFGLLGSEVTGARLAR